MNPAIVADSIVNLCGAVGVGVAIITLRRRDAKSPLTIRLIFALAIVALLFLARGVGWWTGNETLNRLLLIFAASIPLGALVVTEGVLRRHAPRGLKWAALCGALLLGLGGALGLDRAGAPYYAALALFQLGGFVACGALLALRDRDALLAAENRGIDRLMMAAFIVVPFIVTDFRVLFPDIPVRLGAIGALLVISVVLIAGGGAETRRQGLLLMALRIISATLLGAAAAFVSADADIAGVMRFCAISVAGVLTIGLMVDALRALFESRAPGILNAIALSGVSTRDRIIEELARHPIFSGARRLRETDLAAYDPALLGPFLAQRRILRKADAPWGQPPADPAVERIASLLAAHSATHLLILAHDPVDVIALSVPVVSADPATETALALVRRLLVLAPESAR